MIGPGSGSGEAEHHHYLKRRALDELDIESICDEVCGHQHRPLAGAAKRPRFLDAVSLTDHCEASGLQNGDVMYTGQFGGQQIEQIETTDGPVARLEVLVVDGTWEDALESFENATAQQPCSLTELTQSLHQQHDLHSLQSINFHDAYWGQSHAQSQHHQQTAMPKVQASNEASRPQPRPGFAAPLQPAQQQPAYEDQENGNLSWLLDFKLDSFIDAPEDRSAGPQPRDAQGSKNKFNGNARSSYDSSTSAKRSCNFEPGHQRYETTPTAAVGGNTTGPVPYSSYGGLADNRNRNPNPGGPKKPPFTYTELIEHALQERGELTVSAIYQWISEHFPYYKSNDDRWKNSVRHNLSINPHFRKGSKAPHGAGHLWAIASQDESRPRQLFNIATIRQALQNEEANSMKNDSRVVTMDEVAAATASITQPAAAAEEEEENIVDTITLEHCAEQILSGIKREVEVQYLVPMMVSSGAELVHNNQQCQPAGQQADQHCPVKETDFLNPVSKEVVAEECGLIGEGYLVTDLNPSSLGLNMAESEVVSTDNLFGEELSFQFYEFASPSQLQSA